MLDFFGRWFNREAPSKDQAKERLRLVLIHDRAGVSPDLLEMLKEDLIGVISKYMEIDRDGLEINLEKADDAIALVANIPIRQMKRQLQRAKP